MQVKNLFLLNFVNRSLVNVRIKMIVPPVDTGKSRVSVNRGPSGRERGLTSHDIACLYAS